MWKGSFACLLTAAATFAAVPTGTVDLVTITSSRFMCWPICSATASTWRRSAEPSSSGGVPTAMNTTSAVEIAAGDVGREREAALALIPLDVVVEARLVDREDVLLQPIDLRLIEVCAHDGISGLGETRADDEADIAGPDDGDVHGVRVR